MAALSSIAATIEPIVTVRIERARAEFVRGQAETLLAENEKRLRVFFEDSRDMIYTANSDDVVTSINTAGLVLTGSIREARDRRPSFFGPRPQRFR